MEARRRGLAQAGFCDARRFSSYSRGKRCMNFLTFQSFSFTHNYFFRRQKGMIIKVWQQR